MSKIKGFKIIVSSQHAEDKDAKCTWCVWHGDTRNLEVFLLLKTNKLDNCLQRWPKADGLDIISTLLCGCC